MVSYKDVDQGNSQCQVKEMPFRSGKSPLTVTRGRNSQNHLVELSEDVSKVGVNSENGLKQGELGMHWIRGSVLEKEKAWLIKSLCLLFGNDYEYREFGCWGYFDRRYEWPYGVKLLFHSTKSGSEITKGRISFEVPGKAMELLEYWDIGTFCCNLRSHGFQSSRMDIYYDDYERVIAPHEICEEVFQSGDSNHDKPVKEDFTGFRIIDPHYPSKKGVGVIQDEVDFGRRGSSGSDKYLRIYDKELESKGRIKAIRYEEELCGDKAMAAFDMIVDAFGPDSDIEKMCSVIGQIIGGCIDFLYRTKRAGDKNLSRLNRYPFYQKIRDGIGAAKLPEKKIVRTIEKTLEWFNRQVVGPMQMCCKAIGREEFVASLVERSIGSDRLRPHHEKVIADFRFQQAQGVKECVWQEQGFVLPVCAVP